MPTENKNGAPELPVTAAHAPTGQKVVSSVSRPRMVVAALFASIVAFMLLLSGQGMEILTSVRAYVGAEGHWSKAQKDAVYYLHRYARTHDDFDYGDFLNAIAIPAAYKDAWAEIDKPNPDVPKIYAALVKGGNHPDDVPGMIALYLRFRNVSDLKQAMRIWRDGDVQIEKLRELGNMLHAEIQRREAEENRNDERGVLDKESAEKTAADAKGAVDRSAKGKRRPLKRKDELEAIAQSSRAIEQSLRAQTEQNFAVDQVSQLLSQIDEIDRSLPAIEDGFSNKLSETARWAKDLFKWTIAISAALLLTLGILITWRLLSEAFEAKEKYKDLINTANDAILVANRETGKILEANLKAENLTGIPADKLIGGYMKGLFLSEEGDGVHAILRGDSPQTNGGELMVNHADGHHIPVEASVNLTSMDGKVVVQSILRDVSDRKRLEAQLRQAAKMDAVGRLAGGVAHDFNNLLTVISGYGDLLQSQLPAEDPQHSSLDQILKAAERATSLTQQLLAFSRHHMLKPQVFDLNQTVAGVERMLRRLIGEHIELEFQPTGSPCYVKGDPNQIDQVIINLAVNARDAMPSGGKVRIATSHVELSERHVSGHAFLKPGSYVSLSVSDTGHGMDEKTKACIFEPFFTTKEGGKGTGLGLAIVYGTVKQSGGYVVVNSEIGKGTTFEIYLPKTEQEKTVTAVRAPALPGQGAETVLVVEDQNELRGLLRTVLQRSGYTVLEASDGRLALAEYEQNRDKIALVITDMVMPAMGGVDLGTKLREYSPALKILYISGYSDSSLSKHGTMPAGSVFLQKPFTPDVLTRKVREVLDNHSNGDNGARSRSHVV